jgi:phosphatidylglycerol---prolipoprotein diacylglyceryl transferase
MSGLACGGNDLVGSLLTLAAYCTGALVFALTLAARPARRAGPALHWAVIGGAGLCGGLAGAKLTQWLMAGWPAHSAMQIFNPASGGRTIIGGIICGWITVELAKALLRVRFSTGAPFALALPAGEAVGRLGCWFKGCCGGAETSLPWAVPSHGQLVHPSQLYASAAALLTLLALLALWPRLRRDSDLFQFYMIFFGVSRFVIEFTRSQDQLYWGLSAAQWMTAELALAAGVVLFVRWRVDLRAEHTFYAGERI